MDERGAVAENRPLLDPPAVSALDSDDSGSDVEVGDEVGAQMPVRVKCPNGTSFTVHIPPSCTVKEFKALVCGAAGLAPFRARVFLRRVRGRRFTLFVAFCGH